MRLRLSVLAVGVVLSVAAAIASFGIAAPRGPQLAQSSAAVPVDVELVLAVDVSYSMDPDEQQLQREGYMAALTSTEFMQALRHGMHEIGRAHV